MKALALDKDGVIFDSERIYQMALKSALKELGGHLSDEFINRLTGLSSGDSYSLLNQALKEQNLDPTLVLILLMQFRDELIQKGMPFMPGALELIESASAKGIPLALVTSDDSESMFHDFQSNNRLDLMKKFQVVVCLDNIHNPKPHPEPYLLASHRLGMSPSDLLVIEDSIAGATSALEAGAQVLWLNQSDEHPALATRVKKRITNPLEALSYF